jgi:hypothetical protein
MTGVCRYLGGHTSQELERRWWKKICEIRKQIILKFRAARGGQAKQRHHKKNQREKSE